MSYPRRPRPRGSGRASSRGTPRSTSARSGDGGRTAGRRTRRCPRSRTRRAVTCETARRRSRRSCTSSPASRGSSTFGSTPIPATSRSAPGMSLAPSRRSTPWLAVASRAAPPRAAGPGARQRPSAHGRLRHLRAEKCQRGGHLAADEVPADDGRASAPRPRARGCARESSIVRRDEGVTGARRARAGREDDVSACSVVERRDGLAEAQVDALLGVPLHRVHECVRRLGLAAQQPLRERRPVIRAVLVLRPDDDLVRPPARGSPRRASRRTGRRRRFRRLAVASVIFGRERRDVERRSARGSSYIPSSLRVRRWPS